MKIQAGPMYWIDTDDYEALLRVAEAAKEINDKMARVPMQTWVDLQEALKEVEHLL